MGKRVFVTIEPDGTIGTDFKGFEGNCCFEADDRLKAGMREYGLDIGDPDSIQCNLPVTPLQPRVASKTGT